MALKSRPFSSVVWVAATAAAVMIAQQVASKAVRDGFFLTEFEPTALPYIMLASALASFGVALLFGRMLGRYGPARVVPAMFAINGFLFFVEAALVGALGKIVAATVYVHVAALGGAVISGFWSVINERFDPYTAKRVMSHIAGGATVGGVIGGALTWIFAHVSLRLLLFGFGIASLLCTAAIFWVGRSVRAEAVKRQAPSLFSGVSVLIEGRYPRAIALVVFFAALMSGLIDYVFKAGVSELSGKQALVGFFAVFYTATGVVTFGVQALGSKPALKKLGVVLTVCVFPVAALLLLPIALLSPSLVALVALRGGAMVLENSLYRSGYELLYTTISRSQKRLAKLLIDLGCDRLGTAVASGITLVALFVLNDAANRVLLGTAGAVALAMVWVLMVVRKEYVAALAQSLRERFSNDAPNEAQVLAGTFVGDMHDWAPDETFSMERDRTEPLTREKLLAQIEARVLLKRREKVLAPPRVVYQGPSEVSEYYLATPLRDALRNAEDDSEQWLELKRSVPAIIGQLGDLLLSPREDLDVRIRAIELLATLPSQRGGEALLGLLDGESLRLRRAAALGLLRMCELRASIAPKNKRLIELAEQELRRPAVTIEPKTAFERSSPFLYDASGRQLATSVEYVFLLMGVATRGSERLQLALAGITSEDEHQRGTGLEFLDNLLPASLRDRLLALARHPERTTARPLFDKTTVDKLAADFRAQKIDLKTLRQRYKEAQSENYHQAAAPDA